MFVVSGHCFVVKYSVIRDSVSSFPVLLSSLCVCGGGGYLWDHNLVCKFHHGQTRLWFLRTIKSKLVLFTLQFVYKLYVVSTHP